MGQATYYCTAISAHHIALKSSRNARWASLFLDQIQLLNGRDVTHFLLRRMSYASAPNVQ